MTTANKILLIIAGPTAVGKTDLCINLAKKFNTSIISSDSRQFFQEMNIGTAKPSPIKLDQVPHHFINSLSIHQAYDVRQFEKDALSLLRKLFKKHQLVMMTGGSGLYIDAVTKGLDEMPEVDSMIRGKLKVLHDEKGIQPLQKQLKNLDPEYYKTVDKNNPQRLIRALEICLGTGKPYSRFRIKKTKKRFFKTIKLALFRERGELYRRIDSRMEEMIDKGLFEEATGLFPYSQLNALQTVGYTEIFGFLEGRYDRDEAIRLLKRNSRRYAKRQLTWFRRDPSYVWFHPGEEDKIIQFIKDQMGEWPINLATKL